MTAAFREAVIDAGAIAHNVARLREVTGTSEFIAVVKADGYGHGAATAARAALRGGATRLGVADLGEAVALRAAGIDAPVLCWLHGSELDLASVVATGVEVGISRLDQLRSIAAADARVPVHLKLETGLGRNGLAPADWAEAFAIAAEESRRGSIVVAGVFSHLSGTSEAEDLAQLERYLDGVRLAHRAGLHGFLRHLAATGAALRLPTARLDAVRVGLGMYGLSPFDDATSADLGLRPAMTLRATVAAVRQVPAGQGVSYGYVHRTAAPGTLALIPLGYADGVPRQASGRGPVQLGATRTTVAGRIAMDQFIVDLGDRQVAVGDSAVLFGDPADGVPAVEEWADAADTINYEIVTRIGARVPRRVVGE